jgi:hypothetical protein
MSTAALLSSDQRMTWSNTSKPYELLVVDLVPVVGLMLVVMAVARRFRARILRRFGGLRELHAGA